MVQNRFKKLKCSKLAGTTMFIYLLGLVLAPNRAGEVSTFRSIYSARLQEKSVETNCPKSL